MSNSDFGTDGLIATTLKNYRPTLEDNVFGAKVLLWILKSAGIIDNVDGGRSIVQPLIYAGAPNTGSYADDDVFATAANTGISAAEFPWKQYYGLIHFTGIELSQNKGKSALLSLMKARLQQVELTMADDLNTMLWGDGSGNSGKDFMGLAGIISASDPSVGDLGGIDRANTYWKATTKTATSGNTLALADLSNVYNTASEGKDHPDFIVTTQTAYEAYEALLQDDSRYTSTEMGDAGFQNLLFKGAPIAFDNACDDATSTEAEAPVWFLNTQYLSLSKLDNKWFTPSDLAQPTNQDAFYKHLICYGNLVVSNCARQGVLYNVHA
jgi:hypothetical protein